MKQFLFFLFLSIFFVPQAMSAPKILDGDSIRFSRRDEVRLLGIDAPEYRQNCYNEQNVTYDCGQKAKKALIKIVKNQEIKCNRIKKDIYKRNLSECFVGETNINLEMLKQGWAVAYRTKDKAYLEAEEYAKKNKLGVWQGKFMRPELHRALNRK